MADLTRLKVGDTLYRIADANLASTVSQMQIDINGDRVSGLRMYDELPLTLDAGQGIVVVTGELAVLKSTGALYSAVVDSSSGAIAWNDVSGLSMKDTGGNLDSIILRMNIDSNSYVHFFDEYASLPAQNDETTGVVYCAGAKAWAMKEATGWEVDSISDTGVIRWKGWDASISPLSISNDDINALFEEE